MLDKVPQAVCHLDLSVKNVFPRGRWPAAINGAFVGWGAVGSDIGGCALESALDYHLPPDGVTAVQETMHAAFTAELLALAPKLASAAGTALDVAVPADPERGEQREAESEPGKRHRQTGAGY